MNTVFTNSPSRRILSNKPYKIHIPDVASVKFLHSHHKSIQESQEKLVYRTSEGQATSTNYRFARLSRASPNCLDTRSNRHCDQHRGIYNRHAYLAWPAGSRVTLVRAPDEANQHLSHPRLTQETIYRWRREIRWQTSRETVVAVDPREDDLATRGGGGEWGRDGGKTNSPGRTGACRRAKARATARGERLGLAGSR